MQRPMLSLSSVCFLHHSAGEITVLCIFYKQGFTSCLFFLVIFLVLLLLLRCGQGILSERVVVICVIFAIISAEWDWKRSERISYSLLFTYFFSFENVKRSERIDYVLLFRISFTPKNVSI